MRWIDARCACGQAAVVGDGEAETGPLATSWHISKFLNPIRDGAVLPILHLNGYKINNPTLLARMSYLEVENRAQTGPRGSAPMLEVTRARARNRVLVSGSVPLGKRWRGRAACSRGRN